MCDLVSAMAVGSMAFGAMGEYSCQKVPHNIAGYVPHITAQMHHLLLH